MRRIISVLFTIFCLLTVPFLKNNVLVVKANDDVTVWHVPGNFTKIQDAIYSPLVQDGDIIFVHEGTYNENIVINRTLSLVGENKNTTIIKGDGASDIIFITKTRGVCVKDFTIRDGGDHKGVSIDHSVEIDVSNNIILNNSEGIGLYYSSSSKISENIVFNNTNYGISLFYFSSKNVISNNVVYSNEYYGIALDRSEMNLISCNIIRFNNLAGISLSFSTNNTISANILSTNNPYGLSIYYSDNNFIYHNNFDNVKHIFGTGVNFWDFNAEGNHWSDYVGADLFSGPYQNESGSDGVGDTPYIIDNNNRDNYPLMGYFSKFEVRLGGESHYVSLISNLVVTGFKFEVGSETGNKILNFDLFGEKDSGGFSRINIPKLLMTYPLIVLVNGEETNLRLLNIPDSTIVCLYITYAANNSTLSIISSKTFQLYYELQNSFKDLNETYNKLLSDYLGLQKQISDLNKTYDTLLINYTELDKMLLNINSVYSSLWTAYLTLLGNYSALLDDFDAMNSSYGEHLLRFSEETQNLRSLIYILAAITAIFIITIVYLSKHAHVRSKAEYGRF